MKIVKDPVHGDVEVGETALTLLDSPVLQRLRHIRQLGFAHLVYPGANHTRFEHSLGTMHLAATLSRHLDLAPDETDLVTAAALLHDIGHGPFSHVSEAFMVELLGWGHEEVERLLATGATAALLDTCGLDPAEVAAVINGRHRYAGLIHGDLDVDRMDYLLRDAHYTGVPYGLVDAGRLVRSTVLTENGVGLDFSGINAAESLLIARTLMRPVVYYHHVSRIATSMFHLALLSHLEGTGEDVGALMRMDDAALFTRLLGSPDAVAADLAARLYTRRLYKRAAYVGRDRVNAAAVQGRTSMRDSRQIARAIAESAGVEPWTVLVDIPSFPTDMSMGVRVRDHHALVGLEEVSPLLTTLNETRRQQWRLGVYTVPDQREAVEQAATEVLHIKRPTQQDRLPI
ncbi:HD domain-containing protein [Methanofollis formosanus]|uniref:HD domain-containing protein n=1 Tax=Methanofollis formosanus TaxID=299308 RepID=A0A8G1A264_9EURY|nr:HD domain-containing protein [Methanofollis formosanus]QYZ79180.1 HD domain-containing protein [Methanofollis formosanus]